MVLDCLGSAGRWSSPLIPGDSKGFLFIGQIFTIKNIQLYVNHGADLLGWRHGASCSHVTTQNQLRPHPRITSPRSFGVLPQRQHFPSGTAYLREAGLLTSYQLCPTTAVEPCVQRLDPGGRVWPHLGRKDNKGESSTTPCFGLTLAPCALEMPLSPPAHRRELPVDRPPLVLAQRLQRRDRRAGIGLGAPRRQLAQLEARALE